MEPGDTSELSQGVGNMSLQDKAPVIYKFRDIDRPLVEAWNSLFGAKNHFGGRIEVSQGDIFKDGPSADAIVSPANSFGFMDGGIDQVYSMHFGWGMSSRLRLHIEEEWDGELLVGQAAIVPTNVTGEQVPPPTGGHPIPWLICAPTMRVPMNVSATTNAYLAFKAVIVAVRRHNMDHTKEPIRTVLCPGLGTSVGKMPGDRCAYQMLVAFETFDLKIHKTSFPLLTDPWNIHQEMRKYGGGGGGVGGLAKKFEQFK